MSFFAIPFVSTFKEHWIQFKAIFFRIYGFSEAFAIKTRLHRKEQRNKNSCLITQSKAGRWIQ